MLKSSEIAKRRLLILCAAKHLKIYESNSSQCDNTSLQKTPSLTSYAQAIWLWPLNCLVTQQRFQLETPSIASLRFYKSESTNFHGSRFVSFPGLELSLGTQMAILAITPIATTLRPPEPSARLALSRHMVGRLLLLLRYCLAKAIDSVVLSL
jgi:hypothetical protein